MYAVIELQRTEDNLLSLVSIHEDLNEAESKFHQVLAAAAVSTLPVHSAVLVEEDGSVRRTEGYSRIGETEE